MASARQCESVVRASGIPGADCVMEVPPWIFSVPLHTIITPGSRAAARRRWALRHRVSGRRSTVLAVNVQLMGCWLAGDVRRTHAAGSWWSTRLCRVGADRSPARWTESRVARCPGAMEPEGISRWNTMRLIYRRDLLFPRRLFDVYLPVGVLFMAPSTTGGGLSSVRPPWPWLRPRVGVL